MEEILTKCKEKGINLELEGGPFGSLNFEKINKPEINCLINLKSTEMGKEEKNLIKQRKFCIEQTVLFLQQNGYSAVRMLTKRVSATANDFSISVQEKDFPNIEKLLKSQKGLEEGAEVGLALVQRCLRRLLGRGVAHQAHRVPATIDLDGGKRHLDRDFPAVLSPGLQVQRFAYCGTLAGLPKSGKGGMVCGSVTLWHDERMQILTDGFLARVAENTLGRRVPIGDEALRVQHQDGILGRVRNDPQAGFAFSQRRLCPSALGNVAEGPNPPVVMAILAQHRR